MKYDLGEFLFFDVTDDHIERWKDIQSAKEDLMDFKAENMTDLSKGRVTIGTMRLLQKRMKTTECVR